MSEREPLFEPGNLQNEQSRRKQLGKISKRLMYSYIGVGGLEVLLTIGLGQPDNNAWKLMFPACLVNAAYYMYNDWRLDKVERKIKAISEDEQISNREKPKRRLVLGFDGEMAEDVKLSDEDNQLNLYLNNHR